MESILLGGIGCFLLAWISLVGGAALWLADALLIFLVLGRSGNALAGHLVAGAAGIVGTLPLNDRIDRNVRRAGRRAGSRKHSARRACSIPAARFAPKAAPLESAGALAHLLLWSALLTPIAGASS